MDTIQSIISNPAFHDYLAILKGYRNGIVYGVKVRFPHALIMAILFGRGDWKQRAMTIYRATRMHALNLGKFVAIYKTVLLFQRKANNGKPRSADTFIAGLLGGYIVFGERTAVNEQIVLYVLSRVVASALPRSTTPYSGKGGPAPALAAPGKNNGKPLPPDARYFTVMAAITWGAVMWLFQNRGETVQPGMWNSMKYLYRDSESFSDLRTLFWHNV